MRSILFCNEMLGLGHLRLSLALADALVAEDEHSSALVVTGSPAFGGISIPRRVDILKLPTLPVGTHSRWSSTALKPPSGLAIGEDQVRALRTELSLAAVREFRPDVVVVDYRPLGRGGELRPALEWLRADGGCTIALGLWEVDDAPEQLRREWPQDLLAAVRELFDLALVYGHPSPGDVRVDGLHGVGVSVHHTALVAAPMAERGAADLEDGYLLAMTGGGADGFALLDAVLGAIALRPLGIPAVVVTGPMMAADDVAALGRRAVGLDVQLQHFRPDMDAVLAGARAVVSMAGYCTVAEVLGSGKPALLVPRTFPREEQLARARRWAAAGRVAMLDPRELEPPLLREAIGLLLERPAAVREPLTGAGDAARVLTAAVGRRLPSRPHAEGRA